MDKRLHAWREDLADIRLKGRLENGAGQRRFVAGSPAQITVPIASLHRAPTADAMQLTQALQGETLCIFETKDGWSWVQLDGDSYVGYVRSAALSPVIHGLTHRVAVPATLLFAEPNLKSQPAVPLTLMSGLAVTGEENGFLRLATGGHVFAAHACALGESAPDWVSVAEQFMSSPYLWGGKSVQGLDCSGLVQLALAAGGIAAPRDSDMQEESVGELLPSGAALRRGDLVFWDGHVGIMRDAATLLHANGHHLMVVSEPLQEAVSRIAAKGSRITAIRRIQ
jgi:cell wall-associated NlpC family hydrolase